MGKQVDAGFHNGRIAQPVRAHCLISVRSVVRVHLSPFNPKGYDFFMSHS